MRINYCAKFKALALRVLEERGSYCRAAKFLGISSSTLHSWHRHGIEARIVTKRKAVLCPHKLDCLREVVQANSATTLDRIRSQLRDKHELCVGKRHLRRMLSEGIGWTRKRTSHRLGGPKAQPSETVINAFETKLSEHIRQGRTIVSVDECYFSEKVLPLYRGQKCVTRSPVASWKKRSLILAVVSDGSTHHRIIQGSVNTDSFQSFIRSMPFPTGSVVLMDNVSFHKKEGPFHEKGFIPLRIPPYSPQYNPVENVFSFVKGAFRQDWPWRDGVDVEVSNAVGTATPPKVTACFRHLYEVLQPVTTT